MTSPFSYDAYRYLFPPRPETAIHPSQLRSFEMRDYVGQVKKNGTCNMIFVLPKKEIICRKRHFDTATGDGELHALWEPNAVNMAWTKLLPGNQWYVFAAELLHSKVKGGTKDTNYIFDLIVDNGNYLVGQTFDERQQRLAALFGKHVTDRAYSHVVIDKHLWIARMIERDLADAWNELQERGNPEDEGLVLKKRNAKLKPCGQQEANKGWLAKCRFEHKNYAF